MALSGSSQFFKYIYKDNEWVDLIRMRHPLLSMFIKDDDAATGSQGAVGSALGPQTGIVVPWNYATPQSGSVSHQASLDSQDSLVKGVQLLLQTSQLTGYIRWPGKDLEAAKYSPSEWVKRIKRSNIDGAIAELGNQLSLSLHRAGNGIIGQISSVSGTANTITLNTATAAQQFTYGMPLCSTSNAPTNGTPATLVSGALATVIGVNVQYNQSSANFTVTLTLDNVNNFTAGNYIAKNGNVTGFSSTNTEGALIGMQSWIPDVAPAANDSFLNFNRSVDVVRTSGFRFDAGGRTIPEAVVEAGAACMSITGQAPDVLLAHPTVAAKMAIEPALRAVQEPFKIGNQTFVSLRLESGIGSQRVVLDPEMDATEIRGLTLDAWKLYHMGPLARPMDLDGLTLRKVPGNTYAYQMGFISFPQLACENPAGQYVITGV